MMKPFQFQYSNGRLNIKISGARLQKNIAAAQCYLDNAVLRDSNRYVPYRNNVLRESGENNTVIGSGEVKWCTPYAHYQYKGRAMVGVMTGSAFARTGEPKRYNGEALQYHTAGTGSHWFEKAKRVHGKEWIKGVKKKAGGG